jgi:hypothetical protein
MSTGSGLMPRRDMMKRSLYWFAGATDQLLAGLAFMVAVVAVLLKILMLLVAFASGITLVAMFLNIRV